MHDFHCICRVVYFNCKVFNNDKLVSCFLCYFSVIWIGKCKREYCPFISLLLSWRKALPVVMSSVWKSGRFFFVFQLSQAPECKRAPKQTVRIERMKGNTVWEHKHGSPNCTWNAFFYRIPGGRPGDSMRGKGAECEGTVRQKTNNCADWADQLAIYHRGHEYLK